MLLESRNARKRPWLRGVADLSGQTDGQLVALYGEVMHELHRRSVIHSGNNPIADMAERVIADYYGVEPEPPNTKSYDVVTPERVRVQVKALRRTQASRRNLSALRTLEFDVLAAVVFERDMKLVDAIFIPIAVVSEYMGWSNTWKARRLSLTQRLIQDPRVEHVAADALLFHPPRT